MTPGGKPVVGLVGGIGAGKSTAAAAFARRGGRLIDADKLGHEALEEPAVKDQIVARWGAAMTNPDGTVNRRTLAGVVFQNPDERAALEAITFPAIRRRADAAIAATDADPAIRFVVLDAAVMLEAGWTDLCDTIVYIDAPREVRLARLAARSGWTPAEVAAREAAQLPLEDKRRRADTVIVNAGPTDDVQAQADQCLADWGWPHDTAQ